MDAPTARRQSSSAQASAYPSFDSSPWRPIDYQIQRTGSQSEPAQPSAPPYSFDSQNGAHAQSLMDLDSQPKPSLMLGPQELQVLDSI